MDECSGDRIESSQQNDVLVRERRASAWRTVVGSACLWAWGYTANLTQALFPHPGVLTSIGIEYAYYMSQFMLVVMAIAVLILTRKRVLPLRPGTVVMAAVLLAASSATIAAVLRISGDLSWLIVLCGVVMGVAGWLLTCAWGACFSLGSTTMRRMVLLSFLLGYLMYFVILQVPTGFSAGLVVVLPLVSGGLWFYDSCHRHRLTHDVWPASPKTTSGVPGEVAAGALDASMLPWRTLGLIAVAAFVGNFISSYVMGSTYEGAAVIFPGAFAVCSCITLVAAVLEGAGEKPLAIERLYRYVLPFAVLGMLLVLVNPSGDLGIPGALVAGASIFLQALVILKVTEVTQVTGVSPLLSFAVGQGVVGAVVFAGNVGGRWMAEALAQAPLGLLVVCAAGVFALFYLLTLVADRLSDRLVALDGELTSARAESGGQPERRDLGVAGVEHFAQKYRLTPREVEVLSYLLKGRSLPSIAERLFVTAGTVKTHALHIYRKVGVASREELIDAFEWEGSSG